jgi:hypothetical protein
VPPGWVCEPPRTSSPVTHSVPGLGLRVGFGLGDLLGVLLGVGLGDLVGDLDGEGLELLEGDGLLDGVLVLDGLGLLDGLELFDGLGLADGLRVLDGLGLAVCEELELAVSVGVARADAPVNGSALALIADVLADPQTASSKGLACAAKTGAIAGPESRNSPAPAAAAACPIRTTRTGTAALR